MDQPLHGALHPVVKFGSGEARKQTEPSDDTLKERAALFLGSLPAATMTI